MDNGFKALWGGVMLAALLFALLSVMPGVSTFVAARPKLSNISAAPPPAQSALSATGPQPASAAIPPAAASESSSTADQPADDYVFLQEEEKQPPRRWLYANGDVILRKEPQGDPFIPMTASFAPLTIHSGTRLWPVRTEAEWVMVQSPGNTVGWVHKDEVFTNDRGQSGSYYDLPAPRRPWLQ